MTATSDDKTWRDAVAAFATAERVGPEFLEALDAFITPFPRGGPPIPGELPWTRDFVALEGAYRAPLDGAGLTAQLAEELDGQQPALFARRVAATEAILGELGTPAARILRVGLRVRLRGISEDPPPRGRRVRALADYYYSLAALLRHPEWARGDAQLERQVATADWRAVAPGIEHALLDGETTLPLHVNLLRIEPARVRITIADLFACTRTGTDFPDALADPTAAAASGGFFLYSEDDIEPPSARHDPVGLLLADGEVRSPPVFPRAALLSASTGEIAIRRVGLGDVSIRIGGAPVVLGEHWTRAHGTRAPDVASVSVVGHRVADVGRGLPVPLNGFVTTLADAAHHGIQPGDEVAYTAPEVHPGIPAACGVAGGPLVVADGEPVLDMRAEGFWATAPPITFSQDETGDHNLLARMAAGIDAQGRLLMAAIDGRNVTRALGMTLGGVARLMILLGCRRAMNLDGGSSKRMVVDGRTVDLASTEIVAGESTIVRTRPVHTAILFQPR